MTYALHFFCKLSGLREEYGVRERAPCNSILEHFQADKTPGQEGLTIKFYIFFSKYWAYLEFQ